MLRKFGVYNQNAVIKIPGYLTACEAACLPCAGLTAWTSLVPVANIQSGDTVLVQGTGGVAIAALQLSKALGAKVVIISSGRSVRLPSLPLGMGNRLSDCVPVTHA